MKTKLIRFGMIFLILPFAFTSCIKEELPNVEADIEMMKLPKTEGILTLTARPNDQYTITAYTKTGSYVDLTSVTPDFVLSQGATIFPPSGVAQDFSKPVTYKVTSEDGRYSNEYTVTFMESILPTDYHFQYWDTVVTKGGKKYYTPYEISGNKRINIWASGNAAYTLIGPKDPDMYPTRIKINPETGKTMACLVTIETGPMGVAVKMPIAAGNLFIGDFESQSAMIDPMGATHFGKPFNQKPKEFYFSYHYKPATYTLNGTTYVDECDIYAVLYETDENLKYLQGDNVLSHRNIVALARIEDPSETSGSDLVKKTVSFNYDFSNRFDAEKLANSQYNLAVVFTSSRRGAEFIGGNGSILLVEEARVICE